MSQVCIWMETQHGHECWDDTPWDTIYSWMPDESGQVSITTSASRRGQKVKQVTGQDIRLQYGLSPLMVTCWACFVHRCPPEDLRALMALPASRLLLTAAQMHEDEGVSPSPARLIQRLSMAPPESREDTCLN